jgi:uncharacterized OsmC-like protein
MNSAQIKELFGRKASAMTRRPAFARGTGQARISMGAGFRCDVDHGDRTVRADQPESEGGSGTGPHPGQLMRASLGACLAMGYRLWGARLDVSIDAVEVEITCEYDARGQMGVSPDVTIGWERILFNVVITSAEPEAAIRSLVEHADRLSPMLANLSASIRRIHRLSVLRPHPEAERPPQQPRKGE